MSALDRLTVAVLTTTLLTTSGYTAPPLPKPPEQKLVVAYIHEADEKAL